MNEIGPESWIKAEKIPRLIFGSILASLVITQFKFLTNVHNDFTPRDESLIQPTISQKVVPEPHYNFTTAICVAVRDGESYMQEWIDYHLAMKFDAIYIYDDSPTFEWRRWHENTRNHSLYQRVNMIHLNRTDKVSQKELFRACVDLSDHDYYAFIDIDEFLVLPPSSPYQDIRGVLQDYLVPYGGALTVNWMFVGTSDKAVYSPLPVTKRFQFRSNETHHTIKTIIKKADYAGHRNPHAVRVREGKTIHTTKFKGANLTRTAQRSRATDKDKPSTVLLLYHYRFTSTKEYFHKLCVRGFIHLKESMKCDANGTSIGTKKHLNEAFKGDIFDDTPWQFLRERVPKYQLYDEFEDFH